MTERTTHAELPDPFRRVIRRLWHAVTPHGVTWALTGSAGFVLQGVPVAPTDIDVQTDEGGAYEIERQFADDVVDPVSFSEGAGIRSHVGRLVSDGIWVTLMGALQTRLTDGSWEPPVGVAEHRKLVPMDGIWVPVRDLRYEEQAYRRLRRMERADLLRSVIEQRRPDWT